MGALSVAGHVRLRFVADDSQTVGNTVREFDLQLRFLLLYSDKPNFSHVSLPWNRGRLISGWDPATDMTDGPSEVRFLPSLFLPELSV